MVAIVSFYYVCKFRLKDPGKWMRTSFFGRKEEFLSMVESDEILEYALEYGDCEGLKGY